MPENNDHDDPQVALQQQKHFSTMRLIPYTVIRGGESVLAS